MTTPPDTWPPPPTDQPKVENPAYLRQVKEIRRRYFLRRLGYILLIPIMILGSFSTYHLKQYPAAFFNFAMAGVMVWRFSGLKNRELYEIDSLSDE